MRVTEDERNLFQILADTDAMGFEMEAALRRGENPNSTRFLTSALSRASELGKINSVRALIAGGAQVDGVGGEIGSTRRSPVGRAYREGKTDCLVTLLEHGAHFEGIIPDKQGGVLHACFNEKYLPNSAALLILMLRGADASLLDERGRSVLMRAIAARRDFDLMEQLIEHGSDINAVSNEGQSAVELAIDMGSLAVAEWLVLRGADPVRGLAALETAGSLPEGAREKLKSVLEAAILEKNTPSAGGKPKAQRL